MNRANVHLGKDVAFKKMPQVTLSKEARITIGEGTLINSDNRGYHVNMYAPCKLLADRPGAEIIIGRHCRIHGSCIHAQKKIVIGNNCLIAANCQIMDGNAHDLSFPDTSNRIHTSGTPKTVIVEDDVWLGAGVVVLPGVRIGKGSIVSANSVVHKDIPPMVIAAGNPVRIIREYRENVLKEQ